MSNPTLHISDKPDATTQREVHASSKLPAWWIVFVRELTDLWVGGKALVLLFLFSIMLAVTAYVLSSNSELSLIPPNEMVYLLLDTARATGLFIGMIIGADAFSGERERATLEALLLTPTSRRQIVVGKFLAAISAWPVALAITTPFLYVAAQTDFEAFQEAMLWGAPLSTMLAIGFTGFGMLVSLYSNSNRTSLFVSLVVYLLCLLPTQFPGNAQTGTMGRLLKRVNPMEAVNQFLEKVIVNNRTFEEMYDWLTAPIIFFVFVVIALFVIAAPGLRLEGGTAGRNWRSLLRWPRSRAASLLLLALLMALMSASTASTTVALGAARPAQKPITDVSKLPIEIAIDAQTVVAKNGDPVIFTTLVTNKGTEIAPPLVVAMNIINLSGEGDPVDPEDWSPDRTQYMGNLGPGESVEQSWRVNTILEGEYMVYMVVVPKPRNPENTTQPVASSGIHITVGRYVRINPGGVLPVAIAIPMGMGLFTLLVFWLRRRSLNSGTSGTGDQAKV